MVTQFKLINRGFSETLLLIPGWATDCMVFDSLDLDFNYLIPAPLSPDDFESTLVKTLKKESLDKISILGWSLGGYLAASFASHYPEYVKDITLIGMRRSYGTDELDKARGLIKDNKKAYLYKGYKECALPGSLARKYIQILKTDELLEGLDYLEKASLDAGGLKGVKIKFIHGENDKIAPVTEIEELKKDFPGAEFVVVRGASHAPFLRSDFKNIFYGKQGR